MARRPNKPHRDGYEDEEDCEGYYDPDEEERRGCHKTFNRSPKDPCRICFDAWYEAEQAKWQQKYDALSDEEKKRRAELIAGLRTLYDEE